MGTGVLPKWITKRYAILWQKYRSDEFTYEDAKSTLGGGEFLNVVLSELRRNGWLTVRLNPADSRKRIYQLKMPDNIFREINTEGDKDDIRDNS